VKVSSSKGAALAKATASAKDQPAVGDAPSQGPAELARGTSPPDSPAAAVAADTQAAQQPAAADPQAAQQPAAADTQAAEQPAAADTQASEGAGSATASSLDPESTDQRDALNAAFEGNLPEAASRYDQLAKSSGAPVFSLAARLARDHAVRKP
jgi:hypothetical protein